MRIRSFSMRIVPSLDIAAQFQQLDRCGNRRQANPIGSVSSLISVRKTSAGLSRNAPRRRTWPSFRGNTISVASRRRACSRPDAASTGPLGCATAWRPGNRTLGLLEGTPCTQPLGGDVILRGVDSTSASSITSTDARPSRRIDPVLTSVAESVAERGERPGCATRGPGPRPYRPRAGYYRDAIRLDHGDHPRDVAVGGVGEEPAGRRSACAARAMTRPSLTASAMSCRRTRGADAITVRLEGVPRRLKARFVEQGEQAGVVLFQPAQVRLEGEHFGLVAVFGPETG